MGYFPVRYDSRVVIYDRKMFIRLATSSYGWLSIDDLLDKTRAELRLKK